MKTIRVSIISYDIFISWNSAVTIYQRDQGDFSEAFFSLGTFANDGIDEISL